MKIEEIKCQLERKRYKVSYHPKYSDSLVVEDVDDKAMKKLCQQYGASGMLNEEKNIGVLCNFGQYF